MAIVFNISDHKMLIVSQIQLAVKNYSRDSVGADKFRAEVYSGMVKRIPHIDYDYERKITKRCQLDLVEYINECCLEYFGKAWNIVSHS